MKLLAVETATSCQSVALLDGSLVLARSDTDAKGAHARWLIPTIDRVLNLSGLTLANLDGLAVSIGPGSFTGLRVGLATMMGLRLATEKPLVTVPTLEAMAWNVRGVDLMICPILKARTGEVYWAQYRWTPEGELTQVTEERAGELDQMAQSIQGPTMVFGEGWVANRTDLRHVLTAVTTDFCEAPHEAMAASAVSVGLAGLERLARGEVAGRSVSPRYIQRAEAEVAWVRRGGGDGRPAGGASGR